MYTYKSLVEQVIQENKTTLLAVNESEINQLMEEICQAKTIQLYAMGRMQLSVRAFAMRLKHMGFDSYIVYDTTTPCIGPGDLLIGHCAVTNVELNVIKLAKEAGARIALLTAHPENEHGGYADVTVCVPGQIFGGDKEVASVQPMSSLLEQSLFLFVDIITMLLIEKTGISLDEMKTRHTNLEGLPHKFA
ncbi:sugar isomerase [Acerihabitans sp. KWT182]|uniref:Sugar isomerase n=1 Tax=Acerihabitans sp. KWT182 TaxID=3157919 RepID=A0AAU7QCE9_9GAMM